MKKIKYISVFLVICLLLCCVFCSCGEKKTPPPEFESVRDELITRIENSKEINSIFWGKGLPVIPIGSELAQELGLYSKYNSLTTDDDGLWEYVDPDNAEYITVRSIKDLAESAYSDAFLAPVYRSQFEGLYDSVSGGVLNPHYYEDDYWIWKNANSEEEFNSIEKTRMFNYGTMKMDEDKSSGERIFVTVDSYLEGESSILTIELVFDKQEDGWYLSSPTY